MQVQISLDKSIEQEVQSNVIAALIQSKKKPSFSLFDNHSLQTDQVLLRFINHYISLMPKVLQTLKVHAEESGISELVAPLLDIAQDLSYVPPRDEESPLEVYELLEQAYLVHRLIEATNERFVFGCGAPLLPTNMTLSNIVVHELLGEEFAHQLDLVVHYSSETYFYQLDMKSSETLLQYANHYKSKGWHKELLRWPFLAGDKIMHHGNSQKPVH